MIDLTVVTTCHRQFTKNDPPRFYEKHGHKNFEISTGILVESIRKNGGKLKDCKIKIWMPRKFKPSDRTIGFLLDNKCQLVYGSDWLIPAFPNSSKINACSMKFDTEYVFWMDSDSLVLRDFSEIFGDNKEFDISSLDQSEYEEYSEENFDILIIPKESNTSSILPLMQILEKFIWLQKKELLSQMQMPSKHSNQNRLMLDR